MKQGSKNLINALDFGGAHAVFGLDVVGFSKLYQDDQIRIIKDILRWVKESLANHSITDFRWSPAGDGGYLTFTTPEAGRKAIDVAFSIAEKAQTPEWRPQNGEKVAYRFTLHAGTVQEGSDPDGKRNLWGIAINLAARLLSITAPEQLLMSKEYYDMYLKGQRDYRYSIGQPYWRTVKHGVQVEVMNVHHHDLCLDETRAKAVRWQDVRGLWQKTVQEYEYLIHDTMVTGEPMAALAAGKFLLELQCEKPVHDLCAMIGRTDGRPSVRYPQRFHSLFSEMPPDILFKVLQASTPRVFEKDQSICRQGDPAESCFFPVSGAIVVDVPGYAAPIPIANGELVGEFSLWISNMSRSATIRALEGGLLLEIHKDVFREIISSAPHVAEIVYGTIKRRILENILKSERLFPGGSKEISRVLDGVQCERLSPGAELSLDGHSYILFNGSAQIQAEGNRTVEITASGKFGLEEVLGLVSDLGATDGTKALVSREAVVVAVPHDKLRTLQMQVDAIGNAWNSLYGQRLGQLQRAKGPGKS